MPDIYTHYCFGRSVFDALPDNITEKITESVYYAAQNGPDDWATYLFYAPIQRQGKNKRSGMMHVKETGKFLVSLTEAAANCALKNDIFSYLAGYLCHYCLDKKTHPYINSKAGIYDGREKTRKYRGKHLAFEHAIDMYYMRKDGYTNKDRIITKELFRDLEFPENIRRPINEAYYNSYKIENVFEELNRARKDLKLFYLIAEDPVGLMHFGVYPFRKKIPTVYSASYYCSLYSLDYALNTGHTEWNHPFDETLVSDSSFFELFSSAVSDAVKMISGAYSRVFGSGAEEEIKSLYGNFSYSTGFDLDDPRTEREPVFSFL